MKDLTQNNENAIVSIVPENNHMSALLKEYKPMKNE
jgi:hypothetical protein